MNKELTGGPAFPVLFRGPVLPEEKKPITDPFGKKIPPGAEIQYAGLSLRDYFAAKAMQAALTRSYVPRENLAEDAYNVADEMLKARGR